METNKIILEVKDLKKSFKVGDSELEVLKGINLEVREGEFISLMGESGSGKSTLLYQIGFLDTPTSGEIKINGESFSNLSDEKLSEIRCNKIGFVFQFYNLIPNLTVEDNIMLPVIAAKKNASEYEDRLVSILQIIGLSDKRKCLPRELSGGQQQRVAIARAIILSPALLLADEPTGNLDSVSTKEIMELFKTLNEKEHVTIIQVTHSNETAKYGSRLIYLKDGRIV